VFPTLDSTEVIRSGSNTGGNKLYTRARDPPLSEDMSRRSLRQTIEVYAVAEQLLSSPFKDEVMEAVQRDCKFEHLKLEDLIHAIRLGLANTRLVALLIEKLAFKMMNGECEHYKTHDNWLEFIALEQHVTSKLLIELATSGSGLDIANWQLNVWLEVGREGEPPVRNAIPASTRKRIKL
jgi:hypothetical protein